MDKPGIAGIAETNATIFFVIWLFYAQVYRSITLNLFFSGYRIVKTNNKIFCFFNVPYKDHAAFFQYHQLISGNNNNIE